MTENPGIELTWTPGGSTLAVAGDAVSRVSTAVLMTAALERVSRFNCRLTLFSKEGNV